eukprot:gene3221-3498_t
MKILQLSRPPSLPPIFEISRPELKLAGIRHVMNALNN